MTGIGSNARNRYVFMIGPTNSGVICEVELRTQ